MRQNSIHCKSMGTVPSPPKPSCCPNPRAITGIVQWGVDHPRRSKMRTLTLTFAAAAALGFVAPVAAGAYDTGQVQLAQAQQQGMQPGSQAGGGSSGGAIQQQGGGGGGTQMRGGSEGGRSAGRAGSKEGGAAIRGRSEGGRTTVRSKTEGGTTIRGRSES